MACKCFARYIQGMGCVNLQTKLHCGVRFSVTAEHLPGKQLVVGDALSRHPLDGDGKSDTDGEVTKYVNTIVASKPIRPPRLEEIRRGR